MKRYAEDWAILARRAKFWAARGFGGDAVVEPGRFRKRHPGDCGRARCGCCHGDKRWGRTKFADRRAAEHAAHDVAEVHAER